MKSNIKTSTQAGCWEDQEHHKKTNINDFGFRIEISSSNPGQNDRTDLAHLFSIVAWPGKAIFGSKSRKMLNN